MCDARVHARFVVSFYLCCSLLLLLLLKSLFTYDAFVAIRARLGCIDINMRNAHINSSFSLIFFSSLSFFGTVASSKFGSLHQPHNILASLAVYHITSTTTTTTVFYFLFEFENYLFKKWMSSFVCSHVWAAMDACVCGMWCALSIYLWYDLFKF